jgi:hypothetical protein
MYSSEHSHMHICDQFWEQFSDINFQFQPVKTVNNFYFISIFCSRAYCKITAHMKFELTIASKMIGQIWGEWV